jgi:hypothetical protein
MPVLQLTTRQAIEWGANSLLDKQQISVERKNEIRRVTEFNLLTTAFNASTVLLVAGFAAAVFFAYTAAATFGAIGLFLRYATEKEITKYTLPVQGPAVPEEGAGAALWARLRDAYNSALLRNALHQATPDEKIANIFLNVGLPRQENWEPAPIIFDDFAIWRAKIAVPPALAPEVPVVAAVPAAPVVVAVPAVAAAPAVAVAGVAPAVAGAGAALAGLVRLAFRGQAPAVAPDGA